MADLCIPTKLNISAHLRRCSRFPQFCCRAHWKPVPLPLAKSPKPHNLQVCSVTKFLSISFGSLHHIIFFLSLTFSLIMFSLSPLITHMAFFARYLQGPLVGGRGTYHPTGPDGRFRQSLGCLVEAPPRSHRTSYSEPLERLHEAEGGAIPAIQEH